MAFVGKLLGVPQDVSNPLRLTLNTDEPRRLVIGRTGVAGAFGFHGLSGDDNRNFHRVTILAGHKCNAVSRIWADGDLLQARNLQHGVRTEIREYRDGSRQRMWLTWYDGRVGQTADPHLIGEAIQPRALRSTDTYDGMSYVVLTARFDDDSLTSIPTFIFEVDGADLYDRRRDSTAGGNGPQRYNEPSTWTYTNNPAVALDHYQLGILGGQNNDQITFGMGLSDWQVPYSEFRANADVCDEFVLNEARYAANGYLSAADDHRDNVTKLAYAMGAIPNDIGGRIVIRPAQARPVVMTITDGDLVDGATYGLSTTPSGTDLVNKVRGTYRDPNTRYNEIDYSSVQDDALIGKDGREFEHTRDLSMETSATRAQRLATIELGRQILRDRISETYMPIANQLNVGDWFERVSNLRGPSVKVFEVETKRVNEDLTVDIEARETDSSIVAFSQNQVIPIDVPEVAPQLVRGVSIVPTVAVTPIERDAGGAVIPSATFDFSEAVVGDYENVGFFEIEYGVSNGLAGIDLDIINGGESLQRFENNGSLTFEISGLSPSTTYAYRVRSLTGLITGQWSDYFEFVTTDRLVSTSATSIGDRLAIDFEDLLSEETGVPATNRRIQELRDAALAENLISGQIQEVTAAAGNANATYDDGLTGYYSYAGAARSEVPLRCEVGALKIVTDENQDTAYEQNQAAENALAGPYIEAFLEEMPDVE